MVPPPAARPANPWKITASACTGAASRLSTAHTGSATCDAVLPVLPISTAIRPPCACTRAFAICSPNPKPSLAGAEERFTDSIAHAGCNSPSGILEQVPLHSTIVTSASTSTTSPGVASNTPSIALKWGRAMRSGNWSAAGGTCSVATCAAARGVFVERIGRAPAMIDSARKRWDECCGPDVSKNCSPCDPRRNLQRNYAEQMQAWT